MNENDYLVRGMAGDEQIRVFAVTTKNTLEYAKKIHASSPMASVALGRLLSAGAMMGAMMKAESDKLTLRVAGDGPLRQVLVTADYKARVRGYVSGNDVKLPLGEQNQIRDGIGRGSLTVIRDLGMKEPYVSQVGLKNAEISGDLNYYFNRSEQIPTTVALDVLMNGDEVLASGGYIIQLMPFCDPDLIRRFTERLQLVPPVKAYLEKGYTPEQMLIDIFRGFDLEITEHMPVEWHCNCSKERGIEVLATLGEKEIDEMIKEGKEIEVTCDFCGRRYRYDLEDLNKVKEVIEKRKGEE